MKLTKIVITGPESTGKSHLAERLASCYDAVLCPEYAREYLPLLGRTYQYDDLLEIARGQVRLEEACMARALARGDQRGLVFFDTDLYVIKVWCEFVFGKCHNYILEEIARRKYDLYLLCDTDLPWIADGLREYPDLAPRRNLYNMYLDLLVNQDTPWVRIAGHPEERLQKAVEAVNAIFQPIP